METKLRVIVAVLLGSALAAPAAAQPRSGPAFESCGAVQGFTVPGTDACLRIGGQVSAEYTTRLATPAFALPTRPAQFGASRPSPSVWSGSRIGMRLTADVRAQTEFGPVRAYVSLRRRAAQP